MSRLASSSHRYSATASPSSSSQACSATSLTSSPGSSVRPAEYDSSYSVRSRRAPTSGVSSGRRPGIHLWETLRSGLAFHPKSSSQRTCDIRRMLRANSMVQPGTRILTTHTGSLPRPPELSDLMLKHDAGEFDDLASLRLQVARATVDVVKRQRETGIDILNDGEYGKVSYSGYVKERLSGFEGEPNQRNMVDPEFPDWQRSAPPRVRYPTNNGPVELRAPGGVRRDIGNLQAAIDASGVRRADTFMSAASP